MNSHLTTRKSVACTLRRDTLQLAATYDTSPASQQKFHTILRDLGDLILVGKATLAAADQEPVPYSSLWQHRQESMPDNLQGKRLHKLVLLPPHDDIYFFKRKSTRDQAFTYLDKKREEAVDLTDEKDASVGKIKRLMALFGMGAIADKYLQDRDVRVQAYSQLRAMGKPPTIQFSQAAGGQLVARFLNGPTVRGTPSEGKNVAVRFPGDGSTPTLVEIDDLFTDLPWGIDVETYCPTPLDDDKDGQPHSKLDDTQTRLVFDELGKIRRPLPPINPYFKAGKCGFLVLRGDVYLFSENITYRLEN